MKTTFCVAALLCAAAFGAAASAVSVASSADATTILSNAVYDDYYDEGGGSVDVTTLWATAVEGSSDNSFTITATLDVAEFQKYVGVDCTWSGNQRLNLVNVAGNYKLGLDYFVYYSENGLTGVHGRTTEQSGNGSNANFGTNASTPALHRLEDVDLSNVDYIAFTLSHNDMNETYAALTLVSGDEVVTYYGENTGLKWSSGFGSLTTVTYSDALVTGLFLMEGAYDEGLEYLNTAAIKAIPEPATATLSLLALAGLAARRRRK